MRPTKNFLKFNDSQRHALDTRRNLAVRANAGSGKTSVLVERIAQLLAQSWDDKKPLDLTQIVAITFTPGVPPICTRLPPRSQASYTTSFSTTWCRYPARRQRR